MNCADFSEYVSTLCDGEIIPSSAAEHIGSCPACQAKLHEYLEMGAELRRAASLDYSANIPPLVFVKPPSRLIAWWRKGFATMRIPRLAFVVLIASIVALASSLTLVKVRARSSGTVVLLSITAGSGQPTECPLSLADKKYQQCGFIGDVQGNVLGYTVHLLSHDNGRIELGLRIRQWPAVPGTSTNYGLKDVDNQPEQDYWFAPGGKLKIDNPGLPSLTVTGAWMDHVPSFVGSSDMDPGPDEIRIISPLLLRDKEVVGDLPGGSSTENKPEWAVFMYFPKQGGFVIANSRIQDATEAYVNLNRISFEEDGQKYVLLTGAPVTRAQHVWVLHRPNFNPKAFGPNGEYAFISGEALRQASPGIWTPTIPMD